MGRERLGTNLVGPELGRATYPEKRCKLRWILGCREFCLSREWGREAWAGKSALVSWP